MKERFNAYTKSTYDFLGEIFVHCPRCSCKAVVSSFGNFREDERSVKVTCRHCGYSKLLKEKPKDVVNLTNGKNMEVRYFYMNAPIDPYFSLPLWLTKDYKEGILWAYNYDHLDFLNNHIAASLRERGSGDISNRSIGSRLPRWMTAAKNREEILQGINKLKEK